MNKKDKELLLIDLSARINYKVKCKSDIFKKKNLVGMDGDGLIFWSRDENNKACYDVLEPSKWNVKPYLRPMSSMTEEEFLAIYDMCWPKDIEFNSTYGSYWGDFKTKKSIPYFMYNSNQIDYLNSHHFDYRGLIEKGLALPAPEGMYKI